MAGDGEQLHGQLRLLVQRIVSVLARPILQEYDASTVDELAGILPTNSRISLPGNLAARHYFLEIAEASWREAAKSGCFPDHFVRCSFT